MLVFEHTGNRVMKTSTGLGTIDPVIAGAKALSDETRELIRDSLTRHLRLGPADGIVFVPS